MFITDKMYVNTAKLYSSRFLKTAKLLNFVNDFKLLNPHWISNGGSIV